ncbi:MAG: hypothetical protein ACFBSG_08110 [Leptolyngbyaceae cyanobacterium]
MPITVTYRGDLGRQGKVSIKDLADTLHGLQVALERAYLDLERGGITKHERMSSEDYRRAVFEISVEDFEEGSFILKIVEKFPELKQVIDKIIEILNPVYDAENLSEGEERQRVLLDTIRERKRTLPPEDLIKSHQDFIRDYSSREIKPYVERSVINNINSALKPVRIGTEDSFLVLDFNGNISRTYTFDKETTKKLLSISKIRDLLEPVLYTANVDSLDGPQKKGVIRHVETGDKANILFEDGSDFNQVHPYGFLE